MSVPFDRLGASRLADWLARRPVPERCAPAPRRALAAIRRCRTPALGGHVYRCADCAQTDFAYHSCHHRACPRCGGSRTAAWTARQEARLLPVPYFLVTFTVPAELRPVFAAQPAAMHAMLFRESAAALQQVAAEHRRMRVETLLAKPIVVTAPPPEPVQWHLQCPHCHRFSLVRVGSLPRQARAPPRCIR